MDQRIGHYRIISELGRGGMGVVYKAHEESLNRFVAIKVLGEHLAQDPAYVARFLREAQSAARLTHPNIVHIHLVGEDKGRRYFVMEYVTGQSLQQMLKSNAQISAHDAGRLVLQAAAGLAAAHDEGVIHRDIKPANLLIDERGLLKIADFGLALMREVMNRLTATGMVMGTPGYLAPEQCMEMEVDHRTDIYSLGVTFYEMLAGRMPFEASSPLALLRLILDVEPPDVHDLNPNVDPGTRAILTRMMVKNRDERYGSCHELIVDLKAHLDQLVATGLGGATGPTKQMYASPEIPASPSQSRRFDQGDTMGATPTQSLTPAGPTEFSVPPPPPSPTPVAIGSGAGPDKAASAGTPISVHQIPPQVEKKSSAVLIAVVAAVGMLIGIALFAGATWWMKQRAKVAQNIEQPPVIVSTEVPNIEQPAPVPEEVVTLRVEPTPVVVHATPRPASTQAPVARTAHVVKATPTPLPATRPSATAEPEPKPTVEPPVTVQEEVDEVMMQYLDELQSRDPVMERNAAKRLYRTYRENPEILEIVSEVLLDGFARDVKNGNHVDAMAWLCNILGEAGDRSYAPTLRTVLEESRSRKIKGYAKKNLRLLR